MSQRAIRARKLGVAVLVSSVAASLSPLLASPAGAAPPPAPSIAAVCVNADNVNPFTDLGAASGEALAAINCLVDLGVVNGTTATTFSPSGTLTRQQGAALIARIADLKKANDAAGGVTITAVPATGADQFTDDEGSTLEDSINRLAGVDIINGKTAVLFDPTGPLTRGQFASLIDRMETYLVTGNVTGTSPWATTTDFFTDDTGSVHEGAINRVASQGILVGDGNVTSGVNDPISRTQAALVIARVLAENLASGLITAPARPPVVGGTSFPATPAGTTVRQLGGTPFSGTGGVIEYTFTGLDPARLYDVALLQCGDVGQGPDVLNTGGSVSFADQDLDNQADGLGGTQTGEAVIATVGFVVFGSSVADGVSPEANGTLLVRLDSQHADCANVVVFDDNADDETLNLVATSRNFYNAAADKVGVGGPAVWHFAEAATGSDPSGEVVYVDKTADFFVLDDGFRYNYDTADTGHYDGVEVNYGLTFAQLEGYVSIGDVLDSGSDINSGNYSRTNPNRFQFGDDTVDRAAGVVLTAIDFPAPDVDTDVDDVRITWTAPSPGNGDVDEYCVSIYNATTLAFQTADCTDEVNTIGTGDAPTTLVILNVPAGPHVASVYTESETDTGTYESQLSNVATTGAPADTARPTITDARVTTDLGLQDRFDNGDVITLTFSEAMNATTAATGQFVMVDGDGDTFNVTCGGTAACALGPDASLNANRVLTLTLNATIADTNGAGNGVLNMPASIATTNAAVSDVAGNVVNLATSTDVVVDKEAP